MKTIFLLIWSALVVAHADPVAFGWAHNTEPDLAGYRLYIGSQPYVPETTVIIPVGSNRVTVDMQPEQVAWLTAFNMAAIESDPTPALRYHPTVVDIVLESTPELTGPFNEAERFEIFRTPDVFFDPASAQVTSRLNMALTRVEIITEARTYLVLFNTATGKKFFRARTEVKR